MKVTLLLAMMASSLLTTNSKAGLLDGFNVGKKINQGSVVKDVYAGVKFQYFDQSDRVQIVNELLKQIELEYAPLQIKQKRIGLDLNKIKSEALAAEMASANILIAAESRSNPELRAKIAVEQAKSNMAFLDRMQLLLAKFQDTHFSVNERISRPFVYTGLRLRRVQGMVVVGGVDKKFMGMAQRLSGSDLSAIKAGDVIETIDGAPVEQKINELKEFIAGSSDEFRDSQAIRSLTIRNLAYPSKNYITIGFRGAGVFKLPIFANITKEVFFRFS